MIKKKAYIYPLTSRGKGSAYNPYLDNFIRHTEHYFDFLNKHKPSDKGFVDFLKYITKSELLFLNWIENVPDRKGGLLQFIIVLLVLSLKKIFRFQVIWTLHNKISHSPKNYSLKKILFNKLLNKSDIIITHSKEGISFAGSLLPKSTTKIFYFPHPILEFVGNKSNSFSESRDYDVLIWGTIVPYKGIDKFLDEISLHHELKDLRILIAGKVPSTEYLLKLQAFETSKVIIKNQFISNEELAMLISRSNIILFTYTSDSVLSSGVLMDTLAHGALVVGPNVGAFKDASDDHRIIITYDDFNELFLILKNIEEVKRSIDIEKIKHFAADHSWGRFGQELFEHINSVRS